MTSKYHAIITLAVRRGVPTYYAVENHPCYVRTDYLTLTVRESVRIIVALNKARISPQNSINRYSKIACQIQVLARKLAQHANLRTDKSLVAKPGFIFDAMQSCVSPYFCAIVAEHFLTTSPWLLYAAIDNVYQHDAETS